MGKNSLQYALHSLAMGTDFYWTGQFRSTPRSLGGSPDNVIYWPL